MYFRNIPNFLSYLLKDLIWKVPDSKNIYLTFDDGPHPESTDSLLAILRETNVKSTFFCLGNQVKNNPLLANKIKNDGHAIAHHGYEHISGWKTSTDDYVANLDKSQLLIESQLFRPPYGQISKRQINKIKDRFKIIMWSQMPGDFDNKVNENQLLENLLAGCKAGSIIVLHDSPKSILKLKKILPTFVAKTRSLGYDFKQLEYNSLS